MKRTRFVAGTILAVMCTLFVGSSSIQLFAQAGTWVTKAPMLTPRRLLQGAAANGILYAIGGETTQDTPIVEAYNPASNVWSTVAPLNAPNHGGDTGRFGGSAVAVNGKIYMMGGWTNSPALPSNTLSIYDPSTNAWSAGPTIPGSGYTACSEAAVIGSKIYLLNACNGYSNPGYVQQLSIFDTVANSWTTGPNAPRNHNAGLGAVLNGKFYVAGGNDGTAQPQVDVYDPGTGLWTTVSTMPVSLYGMTGDVIDGKWYIVGGTDGTTTFNTVWIYDPVANTWSSGPAAPTARTYAAAATINGTLYVVGGYDAGVNVGANEAFTPTPTNPPPAATSTVISAPTVSYGSYGLVTVTVTSTAGIPTGTVSLTVDGATATSQSLGASGSFAFTLNGLSVGSHSLAASYLPTGNFAPSNATGTLTVIQAVTTFGGQSPTLQNATFFGGPGDQRGTAISVSNGGIYISGTIQPQTGSSTDSSLILKYALPPASTPTWFRAFGSGTDLFGIASNTEGVYVDGSNYSLTNDPVGGKEAKTIVSKFLLDGTSGSGPAGSAWTTGGPGNLGPFFSYSGSENFSWLTTASEGGSNFIYAAGSGQPCSYSAYIVAKYDSSGNFVAAATDSTVGISFGACYVPAPYGSNISGGTVLNGNIYLAGSSSNGSGSPVVWKYDSNLHLLWRVKDTTLSGSYSSITSFGGSLYAVGSSNGASSLDYLIEKLDESGNVVWRTNTGGPNNDALTGVVGVGMRLFAVGYTRSQGGGGADAVVLEIDPATGNILSTSLYGGAQDDFANGTATDGTDLYVIGESRSFASAEGNLVGQNDVMLLRYALTSNPPLVATSTAISAPTVSYGSYGLVTVTVTSNAGIPTGTVSLTVDGGPPITQTLDASGSFTFTLTGLTVGSHILAASYVPTGNFVASNATGTLTVNPATATVTLSNLTQTYTGSPLSPTVVTTPSGLSFSLSGAPDTNAGSYPVTATVTDPNYTGSASGTFVINKAAATVTLSNLTQTYTGNALTPTAATTPANLTIVWTGAPDTNAGSYPVTATVNDSNYQGSASGTFTISKATPTITWGNPADIIFGEALTGVQLNATASFNGSPLPGTFTYTPPAGTVLPAGVGQTLSVSFAPTDTANFNNASASVVITVQPLSQAIQSLTALVGSFNLAQGINNSLDAKLQNILAALTAANAGQRQDAANQLMAFINAVQAQSGNALTTAEANTLIAAAMRILAVI